MNESHREDGKHRRVLTKVEGGTSTAPGKNTAKGFIWANVLTSRLQSQSCNEKNLIVTLALK